MASNRHLGRIIALQTLYEQDFRREAGDVSFDLEEVLARNIARYQKMVDDQAFIEVLVRGVAGQEAELDARLQPIAPEWPIDQIARMDRVILRMGLHELSHNQDVPPKVVINEAVELAKAFGGENSSKFINGVLGTALRQINPAVGNAPNDSGVAAATVPDDAEVPDNADNTHDLVDTKKTTGKEANSKKVTSPVKAKQPKESQS